MVYYTLTTKGRAWLDDDAPRPAKYSKVLAALGELILDNDIPRTASQVAHIAGVLEAQSAEGLSYLTTAGYVKQAPIPQPSEPSELPKIRIRPIEELAAAEVRREAAQALYVKSLKYARAQKKYATSEKGREAHYKFERSEKGKVVRATYWGGEKGKLAQKLYRLNRRHRELSAFLASHPEEKAKIQPIIESLTTQIQAIEKQRHEPNEGRKE